MKIEITSNADGRPASHSDRGRLPVTVAIDGHDITAGVVDVRVDAEAGDLQPRVSLVLAGDVLHLDLHEPLIDTLVRWADRP